MHGPDCWLLLAEAVVLLRRGDRSGAAALVDGVRVWWGWSLRLGVAPVGASDNT